MGFLYINPTDDVIDSIENQLKIYKKTQAQYALVKDKPAKTLDNVNIALYANAGLSADLEYIKSLHYDGIGLYRTELPFMAASQLPNVAEQVDIYKKVYQFVPNKPIIFRTLDIGSDKVLPYFENKEEENPAMGWRSIRITLDRRAILTGQLRALIKACAGKELHVMFPMISCLSEFTQAKATLDIELAREKAKGGILPSSIKVGTMLEVPSLLFQLDELVKMVDFISVGTNDLMQFMFAIDRSNPSVWTKYDALSPAFLSCLYKIKTACKRANINCCICGEMASHPLDAFALLALGYTKLSMNPSSLNAIKALSCSVNQEQAHQFITSHLTDNVKTLRPLLKAYAIDHGVLI